jgi:hypothetical protein
VQPGERVTLIKKIAAGVSSAAGQQPAPTCLDARATIVGTPGNDTRVGTSGQDVIDALQGNDRP